MTRVLLCCADEQQGYALRQRIETDRVEVVAQVLTSHSALNYLAGTEVDVVVVDDGIGPLPVWDLVRQVVVGFPQVGVVAIVDGGGPQTFATAMEAGARGLVTRPVGVEALQARVHVAAEWAASVRRTLGPALAAADGPVGTMVVLAGSKGGVGVTTLATHLALEILADDPARSVCLVDLDLQKGDVPSLLDVRHRRDITDLVPVAEELSARALGEVLYEHASGLRILLAPPEGEDAEEVHEQAARLILGTLRSRFDVVVVDAGACVSEASMVAVELSDEVYVVATPDVTGLRGVRRLTGLWERLSARKEDQVGVILNRVHRRNDIQPDTAQRIVGLPVLPVHLQADFRGLEPAINRRDPALADPRYTADVRRLAAAARLARPLSPEAAARRRTRRGPAKRRDAGQSTLELAGLFGLILLVILLLWQGVLLGVTWTLGGHAASEAARALAVGADPQRAAEESLPFTWADTVEVTVTGQDRVSVLLPTPILFPGTQRAAFPVRVSAGTVSER